MFGINEKGETASIFVEGFSPFFYAMVGDDWTETHKIGFINTLIKESIINRKKNIEKSTKIINIEP